MSKAEEFITGDLTDYLNGRAKFGGRYDAPQSVLNIIKDVQEFIFNMQSKWSSEAGSQPLGNPEQLDRPEMIELLPTQYRTSGLSGGLAVDPTICKINEIINHINARQS